ncbi:MAG TPA: DUF3501 family protein [Burkholderiaceae bacterium]|nr:DUF3501 family protein [Burkholderiaceae bacterium]
MNQPVTRESLMTLEAYAKARPEFRRSVLEHKKQRNLSLGEHMRLMFEDELTVRYQIQEMLRIEKTFEEQGILHELDAYNPLIPDGSNFKATMLIEYDDVEERKRELSRLIGVEDKVWVQVGDGPRIHAIADEDMERENDVKTSSVHFLRFELPAAQVAALKGGASLSVGVDHPGYSAQVSPVPESLRSTLLKDLA